MFSKVVLCFAVLLAVIESGLCTRCYQCISTQNPKCADPFTPSDNIITIDCSAPEAQAFVRSYIAPFVGQTFQPGTINAPNYCHKIVFGSTTIRACLEGSKSNINATCELLEKSNKLLEASSKLLDRSKTPELNYCSSCDGDACNGVSGLVASVPLALSAALISFFVAKH